MTWMVFSLSKKFRIYGMELKFQANGLVYICHETFRLSDVSESCSSGFSLELHIANK